MVRTKRWTRSPRGEIFGVATGLAEWRELPPGTTRIIVYLIRLFTGVFPGAVIYLVLAAILPKQREEDIISEGESCSRRRYSDPVMDARFHESNESDKERDWDERFKNM